MSTVKVNTVDKRTGGTLTLGGCGTTVTLGAGATQSGFGRTGTVDWCTTAKTAPFTGVSGNGYFVNTTCGAVTVTLPATPSAGDIISIADYASTFQTNNLTICRNSSKINGACNNATLSTEGQSITLVYVDATRGWKNTMDSTSNVTGQPNFIVATGGTITCCGDYKTHIFTADGCFSVSNAGNPAGSTKIDYLVVAGGGGGGIAEGGGGAGAGGFRFSNEYALPAPLNSPLANSTGITASVQTYPITVGAGGSPGDNSTDSGNGSSSIFSTITSTGGGAGGRWNSPADRPGNNGGSGGGGAGRNGGSGSDIAGSGNTPPTSPPQGNNGAPATPSPANPDRGGGGGGAGAVGCSTGTSAGPGGIGSYIDNNFIGPTAPSYGEAGPVSSTIYFAGGGGGGKDNDFPNGGTGGDGGIGGGGDGGSTDGSPRAATSGVANTGGGGGGVATSVSASGAGGSGIVIIRYKYQ
jgi:hypothetical protein